MILSDILEREKIFSYSALPLSECRIIKPRLIEDAPDGCFAVMLVVPYPAFQSGRLASFSRIPDYHVFFTEYLYEKTSSAIGAKYPDAYFRIFADHSPIDEREAACRASLGVIGDNGLFISEKYGSFVFLGEIICSLTKEELSDEGISVGCGEIRCCLHCGKCRESCPSGCIGGDKSLCTSALTQKKGILSDTERDIIKKSGMVWGCDACALCCPMNDGIRAEYHPFFTSGILDPAEIEDVVSLPDEEWARYPFSWRKKEVMMRNFTITDSEESDNTDRNQTSDTDT